jgi:hypothetical protein
MIIAPAIKLKQRFSQAPPFSDLVSGDRFGWFSRRKTPNLIGIG